jgi:hypothetical protein
MGIERETETERRERLGKLTVRNFHTEGDLHRLYLQSCTERAARDLPVHRERERERQKVGWTSLTYTKKELDQIYMYNERTNGKRPVHRSSSARHTSSYRQSCIIPTRKERERVVLDLPIYVGKDLYQIYLYRELYQRFQYRKRALSDLSVQRELYQSGPALCSWSK